VTEILELTVPELDCADEARQPEAIAIGRRAFRTIKQNLWFTTAYNVVGIVLAATG
jgi:cation transport ATPase